MEVEANIEAKTQLKENIFIKAFLNTRSICGMRTQPRTVNFDQRTRPMCSFLLWVKEDSLIKELCIQLKGLLCKSLSSMYTVGGPMSHNTKKVRGCVNSSAQPKGNGAVQTGFLDHLCQTSAPKLQTPFTSIKREQIILIPIYFNHFKWFNESVIPFKVILSNRSSNIFIYIPGRSLLLAPAALPSPDNHRITEIAGHILCHSPDINNLTLLVSWIYSCTKKSGPAEMEGINRNTSLEITKT